MQRGNGYLLLSADSFLFWLEFRRSIFFFFSTFEKLKYSSVEKCILKLVWDMYLQAELEVLCWSYCRGGPEEHEESEESKERKESRREGSPKIGFRQACSGWGRWERSRAF